MAAKNAFSHVDNISMHGYIRRVGSGASGYPGASARPTCLQRNLKTFVITMGITMIGMSVLVVNSPGTIALGINTRYEIPKPANVPNPMDINYRNFDDHH